MAEPSDDIRRLLPLKTAWHHILLSLAHGPQHGYAVRAETEERTGGAVTLWPATLYGSIREMEAEGLIVETDEPAGPDDDPRRKYYALTPSGRAALRAETDRLQSLVDEARGSRALRGAGEA